MELDSRSPPEEALAVGFFGVGRSQLLASDKPREKLNHDQSIETIGHNMNVGTDPLPWKLTGGPPHSQSPIVHTVKRRWSGGFGILAVSPNYSQPPLLSESRSLVAGW